MSETIVSDLKVSDSVLSPHPFLLSPQSSLLITHPFSELAATLLREGHSIRFRAAGQSMHPTIRDGETIVVEPIDLRDIKRGDIVLYRDLRGVIAHRVVAIIRTQQRGLSYPQSSILDLRFLRFSTQSSVLSPAPSEVSTQSSALSAHYSFVLRGDAALTAETVLPEQILGRVVSVESEDRTTRLSGRRPKLIRSMRLLAIRLAHLSGMKRLLRTLDACRLRFVHAWRT